MNGIPWDPDNVEGLDDYLETALWATCYSGEPLELEDGSTIKDGAPLDSAFSVDDIPRHIREEAAEDLVDFYGYCEAHIGIGVFGYQNTDNIVHDFFLSRNGHGSGFFNSDYGGHEKELQRVAETFGEWEPGVYKNDDTDEIGWDSHG